MKALCCLPLVALLGACAPTPQLKLPEIALPAQYKEAEPWVNAQPADALPRAAWWTLFGDETLNTLQRKLLANSPDIAAAFARYQQAQASTAQLRAAQSPTVSASLNTQINRQAELRPLRVLGPSSPDQYNTNTLGLGVDYEVDLWGRVQGQVAAGKALDQAAEADLESVRLSLQAQLTDSYIALRGLDQDAALLREAEAAYTRALDLVSQRHQAGLASGLDVARATGQLESTRSQLSQSQAQRALAEHAIAALVGETASGFSVPVQLSTLTLPQVPLEVPSTLLQRRPDIAAAERRVAASNANVGVAQAAIYPAVTLSALVGYQSSDLGKFIRAPNLFWAIGPTLVANLFDGGRRQAELTRVRALLDETGERYRSVVISAFQQVEDSLAQMKHFGAAAASEQAALAASQRSLAIATTRYREGAANYLEVVSAQTASLQAQRSAQDLATRQRRASVQLVRALGGGWTAPTAVADGLR